MLGRLQNTPGDLAEELLNEGYSGMKMWTLDRVAHKTKGLYIDAQDLKQAIAPFSQSGNASE